MGSIYNDYSPLAAQRAKDLDAWRKANIPSTLALPGPSGKPLTLGFAKDIIQGEYSQTGQLNLPLIAGAVGPSFRDGEERFPSIKRRGSYSSGSSIPIPMPSSSIPMPSSPSSIYGGGASSSIPAYNSAVQNPVKLRSPMKPYIPGSPVSPDIRKAAQLFDAENALDPSVIKSRARQFDLENFLKTEGLSGGRSIERGPSSPYINDFFKRGGRPQGRISLDGVSPIVRPANKVVANKGWFGNLKGWGKAAAIGGGVLLGANLLGMMSNKDRYRSY